MELRLKSKVQLQMQWVGKILLFLIIILICSLMVTMAYLTLVLMADLTHQMVEAVAVAAVDQAAAVVVAVEVVAAAVVNRLERTPILVHFLLHQFSGKLSTLLL